MSEEFSSPIQGGAAYPLVADRAGSRGHKAEEPPGDKPTLELVHRALRGDPLAMSAVSGRLRPVVHMRVAMTLLKSRHAALRRSLRFDIEDMVQDVFCFLLEKGLAQWAGGGLSLESWASLLTRNYVIDQLRGRLRREDKIELIDDDALFELQASPDASGEQRLEDADFFFHVMRAAQTELSALDAEMLKAFLDGQTASDVAKRTGRSLMAIEKQRARLLDRIRAIAQKLRRDGREDTSPVQRP